MNRGKIIAIITGAISVLIAVAYLVLVLILDSRGEMKPAPITETTPIIEIHQPITSYFF
ncbi:hypothetical protein [Euhalothece natronophila]|uniref:hypothetical protein n=1 Tax=Euhalothece natronophila TaxID=577489 RepID=UPI00164513EF|nr:hypothetical protein [Euhalothece natronophila]